ncbi:MAG: ATP synthase F1 subunit epsilon [Muribaculaceae bacterium]|nr:ATP synthase F1 subunit epsilon [Bacteroidales bacterium]MDE6084158.1 ATP synthase F1 subunit epsilon [Muribaculaceae bacterium]
MTLEIISAREVMFKGEAEMVTLPGELGSFTVLKNHASLISVLVAGKVVYRNEQGEEKTINIKGGLADVDNNVVSVCIY